MERQWLLRRHREQLLSAAARIAAAAAFPLLLLAPAPAFSQAPPCVEVPAPPGDVLPWAFSAAQTAGGDLVVLDVLHDRLWRLPAGSTAFTQVAGAVNERLARQKPVYVRGRPGEGLLVQLAARRSFAPTDSGFNLSLEEEYVWKRDAGPDGSSLEAAWIWELVGGGGHSVAACSDLYRPTGDGDRKGLAGLVRFPLDRPQDFEVLLERPLDSALRFACRLSLPLIASLEDGSIYALVPGDPKLDDPERRETRIYRAAPGADAAEPLRESLDGLSRWPKLTMDARTHELPLVMSEIEMATMPVGLFGWEGSLYLLARSPLPALRTEWTLFRVDPEAGAIEGRMSLASEANHLIVVPGRERWALLEKGPVLSFGAQELLRIVWMPAEQLRAWSDGGALCPRLGSLGR